MRPSARRHVVPLSRPRTTAPDVVRSFFILAAGTVHTPPSRSISFHHAPRAWPLRALVAFVPITRDYRPSRVLNTCRPEGRPASEVIRLGVAMGWRRLAEAVVPVAKGVVCLTSALQYHESTLQMRSAVWMAIERTAWRPRTDYPRIRFVCFIGAALTEGVTHHSADALCARASALSAEHFGASRPLRSQRRYASSDLGRRSEPTGNGRSRSTFRSGKSGRPSRK
jgi:hypothetical protein